MNAGMIGYIIGGFLGCILLPVLILIVAKFVPAMRRRPAVVYGVCVALVLLAGYATVSGGSEVLPSTISVVLALLFLLWGYVRDAKKAAAAPSK
jgi:hypothetical protein